MADASGTKPGTNQATTFLHSPGFGNEELILRGQEEGAQFTFLYVLG